MYASTSFVVFRVISIGDATILGAIQSLNLSSARSCGRSINYLSAMSHVASHSSFDPMCGGMTQNSNGQGHLLHCAVDLVGITRFL
jgi:hypothetical protein